MSLIERLGLFVIIVLGEVVVGAVAGMAEVREAGSNGVVIGMLGVLVAIGLWWIYFDIVSHRRPRANLGIPWLLLHLPMVMAIAAGGAGVLNTVEHAGEPLPAEVRWLLAGSLATAVVSVFALSLVLEARRELPQVYRAADTGLVIASVAIVGIGFTPWGAKATLGAMAALLLVPVALGIIVWLRTTPEASEFDIA